MIKLDAWANGKPPLIAIIAQQIAVSADSCYIALTALKSGEPIEGYKKPPKLAEWINFYKNHRIIIQNLKGTLKRFDEIAEIGIFVSDILILNRKVRRRLGSKKFNNKPRKDLEGLSQEDWKEIQEVGKTVYQISLKDIESDIKGEYDDELSKEIKESLKDPEMLFFIKVWAPCWLLYREFPPTLLRSARLGNIKALEKLIRLDKSIIHDPKIAEFLHQAKEKKNKAIYNDLIKTLQKGPKEKITLQKIKMNLAGLISAISSAFGHRLLEPQLRSLFDAVAQDTDKGDIDTDIPDSPEAFAKAIQRERRFWSIIPQPDKK